MLMLLITIGVVLLSSAICSGSEAALFSVPIVKVRRLAQSKSARRTSPGVHP